MARSVMMGLFVVLLCISGCGRKLEEGEIIDKHYEPESEFVMLIPIVIGCGKNCTATMMVPYWVHDDEYYVLTVRGHDEDGELITESWYVDKATYDRAEAGRRERFIDVHASRDDEHQRLGVAEN